MTNDYRIILPLMLATVISTLLAEHLHRESIYSLKLARRGIRLERGMRPEDLFPAGEQVQQWRSFYQRALEEGPFTTEYLAHADSNVLQLSFNVVKRDDRIFGVSAFGKDVTHRKQAEAELLRQRAELAHVSRVSTLGELAASVAHELNQPLGAILANAEAAELFLEQEPPALHELRPILAAICRDDERAGEVIRRMRNLLRKRELERVPVDINSLVEDVLQLVSGDASLRGVSLIADLAPGLPKVYGDRVHLQQVLLNLIINGMDAMAGQARERRRMWVRTRAAAENQMELAVIDSGEGVEPEKLKKLFTPFFTTKANGMGMGLSIARTIIEAHHGRIWAENNTTGGAAFRILLPTTKPARGAGGTNE
jgi:C4-dicarboxylate-specific signal transduction histidine kinase